MKSHKTFFRIMESIEKVRKNLTSNNEAEICIEELMAGEDMDIQFSRETFQGSIKKSLENLQNFLILCKKEINEQKIKIDSIELVGEATRIPVIQDCIKNFIGSDKQELSRTLNSQDCVARGCAIASAQICGKY